MNQWLRHLIPPNTHLGHREDLELSSYFSVCSHAEAVKPFRPCTVSRAPVHCTVDGVPQAPKLLQEQQSASIGQGMGDAGLSQYSSKTSSHNSG